MYLPIEAFSFKIIRRDEVEWSGLKKTLVAFVWELPNFCDDLVRYIKFNCSNWLLKPGLPPPLSSSYTQGFMSANLSW